MALVDRIFWSYREPRKVMAGFLGEGIDEKQTLGYALIIGVLNLVSLTPGLIQRAQDYGVEFAGLFANQFAASIFGLPIMLYLLAAIIRILARLVGGKGRWSTTRFAVIWSVLVLSPISLALGLLEGFFGSPLWVLALAGATFFLFLWQAITHISYVESGAT